MFNLTAATTTVATDAAGRPLEIRTDGQRLSVTVLESIRDETAAYPVETGPRTVFVVSAAERRYRLVHSLRTRQWMVEEITSPRPALAHAA